MARKGKKRNLDRPAKKRKRKRSTPAEGQLVLKRGKKRVKPARYKVKRGRRPHPQ